MKKTILVVDDEPTILAAMANILNTEFQVLAANSGSRAITIAGSTPRPDLILLDLLLPDINGHEVLSKLKQDPLTAEIPVIFVTGMEEENEEEKGLSLGAVDYILKPLKPAIMLARIRGQLLLKEARDYLNSKNVYLEQEISRRMAEILIIQNVTIRALAHIAETRDPETGNHILRTQNYVKKLSNFLQNHPAFENDVSEHFIDLLTKSAPLHDIGKVGIPDVILLKPGKLNQDEWEIMKTHAEMGARAIERAEKDVEQSVEFLCIAKEVARWHHERWDGNGYPDKLKADEIPLSARIMALADVFDALISKRIYKQALSFAEAKRIIESEQGKHFDPNIAQVFIDNFNDFVEIAQKFED